MAVGCYHKTRKPAMRNHKNLMFWEELIRVLVRSYRFATSLPGNDQFTLGTEIKRQAVRVRTKVVAAGSIESPAEAANALDAAYQGLKEIGSSIEFAVELGMTKPELVSDLLESLDRLAGAVFSYRRSMS
jgi:four helix bundle protein